jgi:hypothetical protein
MSDKRSGKRLWRSRSSVPLSFLMSSISTSDCSGGGWHRQGDFSEAPAALLGKDVPGLSPSPGAGISPTALWVACPESTTALYTGHWALAPSGNHERRRVVARRILRQAKKSSRVARRQQASLHKARSELLDRSACPIATAATTGVCNSAPMLCSPARVNMSTSRVPKQASAPAAENAVSTAR